MMDWEPIKDIEPEKKKKNKLLLIVGLPILSVALAVIVLCLTVFSDASKYDSFYGTVSIIKSAKFSEKYSTYLEMDKNISGFLRFSDKFFLPVVSSEDEYYSSHFISGEENKYGTPYSKSSLSREFDIIFSNDFEDGRNFSSLDSSLKKGFEYKKLLLSLETAEAENDYVLFSAFSFENEQAPFLIERKNFLDAEGKLSYILNLKKHSKIKYPVDSNDSDDLLILVSQGEDKTKVFSFRKLRDTESKGKIDAPEVSASTEINPSVDDPEENDETDTSEPTETKPNSSEASKPDSSTSSQKPQKDEYDDIPVSENYETGRFEQTGLTDTLDKTVKVEVSAVVTMVNVTGMSKQGAKNTVKNTLGLPVKIVEEESEKPRGTVIRQSVAEGAKVSTDVTVTLYVSLGLSSGKTICPDLIGGLDATAEIILNKSNLKLGKKTYSESSLEKGTIIGQSVEEGEEISVNTKIDLVISDGSIDFKTVKMPKITGKSKEKAKSAIKAAGLKVGTISTVASSKSAGTVISQECPAGEKIEEGSVVAFSVSNGSKINNLTVTNISSWSVNINGKTYGSGAIIKGDYMDIIPYIVEAEMGSGFNTEALKAQAVAAYCWLINAGSEKGAAPGVPMKNPSQKAISAAKAVMGQKVKYKGEVAQTYYYAIAAGYSANCKDVWWEDIPYLRAVESPGDKKYSGYKTKVSYSSYEMQSMIYNAYGIDVSSLSKSKWFSIKYDENNAYVRSCTIGGSKKVTGSSIRETLCGYDLRSTAFKIKYDSSSDRFIFTVYGYGHGIGMSQVGANYYAELGWNYKQILAHYYKGTSLA